MPNAFAYLVLYSWPLVVLVLFWKLPLSKALVASILGGYLFLPEAAGLDLPILPPLNKDLVPSFSAAVMCLFMARKSVAVPRVPQGATGGLRAVLAPQMPPAAPLERTKRGRMIFRLLFLVLFLVPVLTVYGNPEPVPQGPFIIPGLRAYDIGSLILQLSVSFLPFWLAQRYLAQPEDQVMLLRAFAWSGLGYSLLCLVEIRLSPQLNNTLYGFYPSDFLQQMRAGGFRPMVFLHHGLWVGIYLAMTVLAAATLALWNKRNGQDGLSTLGWVAAAMWLLLVLILSKAVGALALTLLLLPVLVLAGTQGQLLCAMVIACVTLFYPLLRGAGWIPVDAVYEFSRSVSEERASSLKYRLDNEDLLLARAAEKPVSGWGSWGRNLLYEEYDGRIRTVPDGAWIIVIGAFGWLGYISHFGLLTVPMFLLGWSRRKLGVTVETSGLALLLGINLLDLIPNATLTPLTYMVAGALAGRYALATRSAEPAPVTGAVAEGAKTGWPVHARGRRRGETAALAGSGAGAGATATNAAGTGAATAGATGGDPLVRSAAGPRKIRQPRR